MRSCSTLTPLYTSYLHPLSSICLLSSCRLCLPSIPSAYRLTSQVFRQYDVPRDICTLSTTDYTTKPDIYSMQILAGVLCSVSSTRAAVRHPQLNISSPDVWSRSRRHLSSGICSTGHTLTTHASELSPKIVIIDAGINTLGSST